jgi:hypothetical protein
MAEGFLMNKFKFPIFVIEGMDIAMYNSLDQIQKQLESVDVKNQIYSTYDYEGRLLKLDTDGKQINVIFVEEDPRHARDLEEKLRRTLRFLKEPRADDETCDLQCLVKVSQKYIWRK